VVAPRPRSTALLLAGWTAFVWVTRIGNIVGDDELSTADKAGGAALAISFGVLAVLVAWAALRRRQLLGRLVLALTIWTVAVWAVRVVGMTGDDHSVGFVVAHVALAVISIALCVVALRELLGDRDGFFGRRAAG
jgi:hypothetical protein